MVVHSGQVEPLQADAGHPVLDLLGPQLRRLLLLLYQPGKEVRRLKLGSYRNRKHICISYSDNLQHNTS